MSGFINLELNNSSSNITVSKTAILYIEEDSNGKDITYVHCVAGITHTVKGKYETIQALLPKFIKTSSPRGKYVRVSINDWNVSYIEGTKDGVTIFFSEPGVSVIVNDSFENITSRFHAL